MYLKIKMKTQVKLNKIARFNQLNYNLDSIRSIKGF